jgi:hypothetical protein
VRGADAIVYGIGSLYTSICPSLILDGVGEGIAARQDTLKVGSWWRVWPGSHSAWRRDEHPCLCISQIVGLQC